MKDKGLNRALVQEFNTSTRGENKAFYGFRKMFWTYLKKLNVPFSDPCCDTASGSDIEPIGWDESQGQFVRWDGSAWVAIIAFATTTTTTAAPTTTTTTTAAPTTTTTTLAPSDINLKQNIQPTGNMVGKLKEYTWEWNDAAKALNLTAYPRKGVLAQEALELYPEFVVMHEDGYYRVNLDAISKS